MTVITHPRRKSNLARMIDSAGGVSVGAALAQARANVEALRERAQTVVEAQISALDTVPPPVGLDDTPSRLNQVYCAATELIDAAGPFELFDLCQAAGGLCDLIGAVQPGEAFDWRIVVVHARSLRLLHSLPAEAVEERARILQSLGEVLERKRAQTG
ncbi:MAG: 2-amino-4-hydroxy-6-hydroxymethyldihydropteridine diphosphokinase [Caulobacteraceae bacterium]|nr:2-amino-4-hydroxy-6-hydroxymethyldihydropteridine diphosphokinase [Caulobacteraceae bacterium]